MDRTSDSTSSTRPPGVRVIRLANFVGGGEAWGRPAWVVALWLVAEWAFVTNSLQVSSKLRVATLKAFGADIGSGVIFRPRTRVKSPWKLVIGNDCWIGEGVWFHNQDLVTVGSDVVISQDTLLTTGSHKARDSMQLVTSPITIEDGVWITARCVVTGGSFVGASAVASPMTVVRGIVPANTIVGPTAAHHFGPRFAG